jgi:asparagine synthase (glutamine-hydrolysing)
MCGITGELSFRGRAPVEREAIVAMRDELVHRGPDSEGVYVDPHGRAGLGFRRLRIIDLSANASQPMANEDGTVRMVFNGEVYNFKQLREGLIARGHQFRSQSDSETIIHLYEEQGADAIKELDGMFALAIWDERRARLLLARDRAGKKPLFYYRDGERLAFASEMKAFFAHPEIRLDVDRDAIPYYFIYGYVPTPQTFYKNVRQVEPGTLLMVDIEGQTTEQRYWSLPAKSAERVAAEAPSRAEATAEVRELVTRAVERRLMSDVPLGAFLSGGVDSSIVVGVMSQLMTEPVKTFSIGFEGDPAYDETSYARIVANKFKTDHTEFVVGPSHVDLIEKLIWHHDGPFGDSSAVPTYIVSELTRRHVTVVLTGDGGDELFAGYIRFYAAILSEQIPRPVGQLLNGAFALLPTPAQDKHPIARAQRFFRAMSLPFYDRITRWSSLFFNDLDRLLDADFVRSIAPIEPLRYMASERAAMEPLSPLGRVLHINFMSYLLDDLLIKMDRCSMANSLEARSPFLDKALIEYVMTLPDHYKMQRGKTKVILKDAFSDLLPPEIQTRGKMGFSIPLGTWFRGDLRDYLRDLLLSSEARYTEYLSASYVHDLVERHQSGRDNLGNQLWSIMCFELWLRLLGDWRTRHARSRVSA